MQVRSVVKILRTPILVTPLPKAPLRMILSFTSDNEDDVLNSTIQDSNTGSVVYTADTPRHAGGTLTTTITRWNSMDGSAKLAFRILWKGTGKSLGDVRIVSDFRTLEEIPVREVLGSAPGSTT